MLEPIVRNRAVIAAKQTILRVHLIPRLGSRRLDAIRNEHVQRLKHALRRKAPKTVNNVLSVLNTLLRTAVEWDIVEQMPCTIRLLPVPKASADVSRLRGLRAVGGHRLVRRTGKPTSSCCWAVRQDCGAARCWHSNGRMLTSTRANSASSDPSGKDTSRHPKEDGSGISPSRCDWRQRYASTDIS